MTAITKPFAIKTSSWPTLMHALLLAAAVSIPSVVFIELMGLRPQTFERNVYGVAFCLTWLACLVWASERLASKKALNA